MCVSGATVFDNNVSKNEMLNCNTHVLAYWINSIQAGNTINITTSEPIAGNTSRLLASVSETTILQKNATYQI